MTSVMDIMNYYYMNPEKAKEGKIETFKAIMNASIKNGTFDNTNMPEYFELFSMTKETDEMVKNAKIEHGLEYSIDEEVTEIRHTL